MEDQATTGVSVEAQGAGLQALLNRVFRCRHRHKTFPFTPKDSDQCYAVCLDCGQRIPAEAPLTEKPLQSKAIAAEEPKKGAVKPLEERAERRNADARPAGTGVKDTPAAGLRKNNLHDMLWICLFVVGLSGGLYFTARTPARPDLRSGSSAAQTSGSGETEGETKISATAPYRSLENDARPDALSEGRGASTDAQARTRRTPRLEDKGPVVVLGFEAAAVRELSGHPSRLKDLIQSGSLFTVPHGTRIRVGETNDGAVKVLILEGSMAGREGWALLSQVTR